MSITVGTPRAPRPPRRIHVALFLAFAAFVGIPSGLAWLVVVQWLWELL